MEEEEQKAMLYRDPDAFIDNWVTLIWKGHDPFEWLSMNESEDGMFDVIARDYVDFKRWFAPSTKPYKNREQALAALGRLLDKEAADPDTLSFADIQRIRSGQNG